MLEPPVTSRALVPRYADGGVLATVTAPTPPVFGASELGSFATNLADDFSADPDGRALVILAESLTANENKQHRANAENTIARVLIGNAMLNQLQDSEEFRQQASLATLLRKGGDVEKVNAAFLQTFRKMLGLDDVHATIGPRTQPEPTRRLVTGLLENKTVTTVARGINRDEMDNRGQTSLALYADPQGQRQLTNTVPGLALANQDQERQLFTPGALAEGMAGMANLRQLLDFAGRRLLDNGAGSFVVNDSIRATTPQAGPALDNVPAMAPASFGAAADQWTGPVTRQGSWHTPITESISNAADAILSSLDNVVSFHEDLHAQEEAALAGLPGRTSQLLLAIFTSLRFSLHRLPSGLTRDELQRLLQQHQTPISLLLLNGAMAFGYGVAPMDPGKLYDAAPLHIGNGFFWGREALSYSPVGAVAKGSTVSLANHTRPDYAYRLMATLRAWLHQRRPATRSAADARPLVLREQPGFRTLPHLQSELLVNDAAGFPSAGETSRKAKLLVWERLGLACPSSDSHREMELRLSLVDATRVLPLYLKGEFMMGLDWFLVGPDIPVLDVVSRSAFEHSRRAASGMGAFDDRPDKDQELDPMFRVRGEFDLLELMEYLESEMDWGLRNDAKAKVQWDRQKQTVVDLIELLHGPERSNSDKIDQLRSKFWHEWAVALQALARQRHGILHPLAKVKGVTGTLREVRLSLLRATALAKWPLPRSSQATAVEVGLRADDARFYDVEERTWRCAVGLDSVVDSDEGNLPTHATEGRDWRLYQARRLARAEELRQLETKRGTSFYSSFVAPPPTKTHPFQDASGSLQDSVFGAHWQPDHERWVDQDLGGDAATGQFKGRTAEKDDKSAEIGRGVWVPLSMGPRQPKSLSSTAVFYRPSLADLWAKGNRPVPAWAKPTSLPATTDEKQALEQSSSFWWPQAAPDLTNIPAIPEKPKEHEFLASQRNWHEVRDRAYLSALRYTLGPEAEVLVMGIGGDRRRSPAQLKRHFRQLGCTGPAKGLVLILQAYALAQEHKGPKKAAEKRDYIGLWPDPALGPWPAGLLANCIERWLGSPEALSLPSFPYRERIASPELRPDHIVGILLKWLAMLQLQEFSGRLVPFARGGGSSPQTEAKESLDAPSPTGYSSALLPVRLLKHLAPLPAAELNHRALAAKDSPLDQAVSKALRAWPRSERLPALLTLWDGANSLDATSTRQLAAVGTMEYMLRYMLIGQPPGSLPADTPLIPAALSYGDGITTSLTGNRGLAFVQTLPYSPAELVQLIALGGAGFNGQGEDPTAAASTFLGSLVQRATAHPVLRYYQAHFGEATSQAEVGSGFLKTIRRAGATYRYTDRDRHNAGAHAYLYMQWARDAEKPINQALPAGSAGGRPARKAPLPIDLPVRTTSSKAWHILQTPPNPDHLDTTRQFQHVFLVKELEACPLLNPLGLQQFHRNVNLRIMLLADDISPATRAVEPYMMTYSETLERLRSEASAARQPGDSAARVAATTSWLAPVLSWAIPVIPKRMRTTVRTDGVPPRRWTRRELERQMLYYSLPITGDRKGTNLAYPVTVTDFLSGDRLVYPDWPWDVQIWATQALVWQRHGWFHNEQVLQSEQKQVEDLQATPEEEAEAEEHRTAEQWNLPRLNSYQSKATATSAAGRSRGRGRGVPKEEVKQSDEQKALLALAEQRTSVLSLAPGSYNKSGALATLRTLLTRYGDLQAGRMPTGEAKEVALDPPDDAQIQRAVARVQDLQMQAGQRHNGLGLLDLTLDALTSRGLLAVAILGGLAPGAHHQWLILDREGITHSPLGILLEQAGGLARDSLYLNLLVSLMLIGVFHSSTFLAESITVTDTRIQLDTELATGRRLGTTGVSVSDQARNLAASEPWVAARGLVNEHDYDLILPTAQGAMEINRQRGNIARRLRGRRAVFNTVSVRRLEMQHILTQTSLSVGGVMLSRWVGGSTASASDIPLTQQAFKTAGLAVLQGLPLLLAYVAYRKVPRNAVGALASWSLRHLAPVATAVALSTTVSEVASRLWATAQDYLMVFVPGIVGAGTVLALGTAHTLLMPGARSLRQQLFVGYGSNLIQSRFGVPVVLTLTALAGRLAGSLLQTMTGAPLSAGLSDFQRDFAFGGLVDAGGSVGQLLLRLSFNWLVLQTLVRAAPFIQARNGWVIGRRGGGLGSPMSDNRTRWLPLHFRESVNWLSQLILVVLGAQRHAGGVNPASRIAFWPWLANNLNWNRDRLVEDLATQQRRVHGTGGSVLTGGRLGTRQVGRNLRFKQTATTALAMASWLSIDTWVLNTLPPAMGWVPGSNFAKSVVLLATNALYQLHSSWMHESRGLRRQRRRRMVKTIRQVAAAGNPDLEAKAAAERPFALPEEVKTADKEDSEDDSADDWGEEDTEEALELSRTLRSLLRRQHETQTDSPLATTAVAQAAELGVQLDDQKVLADRLTWASVLTRALDPAARPDGGAFFAALADPTTLVSILVTGLTAVFPSILRAVETGQTPAADAAAPSQPVTAVELVSSLGRIPTARANYLVRAIENGTLSNTTGARLAALNADQLGLTIDPAERALAEAVLHPENVVATPEDFVVAAWTDSFWGPFNQQGATASGNAISAWAHAFPLDLVEGLMDRTGNASRATVPTDHRLRQHVLVAQRMRQFRGSLQATDPTEALVREHHDLLLRSLGVREGQRRQITDQAARLVGRGQTQAEHDPTAWRSLLTDSYGLPTELEQGSGRPPVRVDYTFLAVGSTPAHLGNIITNGAILSDSSLRLLYWYHLLQDLAPAQLLQELRTLMTAASPDQRLAVLRQANGLATEGKFSHREFTELQASAEQNPLLSLSRLLNRRFDWYTDLYLRSLGGAQPVHTVTLSPGDDTGPGYSVSDADLARVADASGQLDTATAYQTPPNGTALGPLQFPAQLERLVWTVVTKARHSLRSTLGAVPAARRNHTDMAFRSLTKPLSGAGRFFESPATLNGQNPWAAAAESVGQLPEWSPDRPVDPLLDTLVSSLSETLKTAAQGFVQLFNAAIGRQLQTLPSLRDIAFGNSSDVRLWKEAYDTVAAASNVPFTGQNADLHQATQNLTRLTSQMATTLRDREIATAEGGRRSIGQTPSGHRISPHLARQVQDTTALQRSLAAADAHLLSGEVPPTVADFVLGDDAFLVPEQGRMAINTRSPMVAWIPDSKTGEGRTELVPPRCAFVYAREMQDALDAKGVFVETGLDIDPVTGQLRAQAECQYPPGTTFWKGNSETYRLHKARVAPEEEGTPHHRDSVPFAMVVSNSGLETLPSLEVLSFEDEGVFNRFAATAQNLLATAMVTTLAISGTDVGAAILPSAVVATGNLAAMTTSLAIGGVTSLGTIMDGSPYLRNGHTAARLWTPAQLEALAPVILNRIALFREKLVDSNEYLSFAEVLDPMDLTEEQRSWSVQQWNKDRQAHRDPNRALVELRGWLAWATNHNWLLGNTEGLMVADSSWLEGAIRLIETRRVPLHNLASSFRGEALALARNESTWPWSSALPLPDEPRPCLAPLQGYDCSYNPVMVSHRDDDDEQDQGVSAEELWGPPEIPGQEGARWGYAQFRLEPLPDAEAEDGEEGTGTDWPDVEYPWDGDELQLMALQTSGSNRLVPPLTRLWRSWFATPSAHTRPPGAQANGVGGLWSVLVGNAEDEDPLLASERYAEEEDERERQEELDRIQREEEEARKRVLAEGKFRDYQDRFPTPGYRLVTPEVKQVQEYQQNTGYCTAYNLENCQQWLSTSAVAYNQWAAPPLSPGLGGATDVYTWRQDLGQWLTDAQLADYHDAQWAKLGGGLGLLNQDVLDTDNITNATRQALGAELTTIVNLTNLQSVLDNPALLEAEGVAASLFVTDTYPRGLTRAGSAGLFNTLPYWRQRVSDVLTSAWSTVRETSEEFRELSPLEALVGVWLAGHLTRVGAFATHTVIAHYVVPSILTLLAAVWKARSDREARANAGLEAAPRPPPGSDNDDEDKNGGQQEPIILPDFADGQVEEGVDLPLGGGGRGAVPGQRRRDNDLELRLNGRALLPPSQQQPLLNPGRRGPAARPVPAQRDRGPASRPLVPPPSSGQRLAGRAAVAAVPTTPRVTSARVPDRPVHGRGGLRTDANLSQTALVTNSSLQPPGRADRQPAAQRKALEQAGRQPQSQVALGQKATFADRFAGPAVAAGASGPPAMSSSSSSGNRPPKRQKTASVKQPAPTVPRPQPPPPRRRPEQSGDASPSPMTVLGDQPFVSASLARALDQAPPETKAMRTGAYGEAVQPATDPLPPLLDNGPRPMEDEEEEEYVPVTDLGSDDEASSAYVRATDNTRNLFR